MPYRAFVLILLLLLLPASGGAQAPAAAQPAPPQSVCADDAHASFHACAVAAAKAFAPARTRDGKPDLSGFWRKRGAAHESIEAHPKNPDDAGGTSAIVDPADGITPVQPWAKAQYEEHVKKYMHQNAACFLSGVPGTMYMTGLFQFIQTPDHIVFLSEEAHPYRIVPFDNRPHVGKNLLMWQGDSRGRWDGNTLVIDTTNQKARAWLDQRGRFFTDEARVTERITPVDANTLHYQVTLDDANVYTRPFTMAFAFRRNAQASTELWEEACHEQNGESMSHFRAAGFGVFPGISGRQARELKAAFEAREGRR